MGATDSLKLVFAGTPAFAASVLSALAESRHRVVAVLTQPDRPAGRGRMLTASPVKRLADALGLPVHQPEVLDEAATRVLAACGAQVMVVAAYGLILPPAVLGLPPLGCLNVHASLLPRWRGAAPVQRAILAGDRETGVTIMQMDEGLDTGDMLDVRRTPLAADDDAGRVHDRLAALGAEAMVSVLDRLTEGPVPATPQDDSAATYARRLSKQEARIDWQLDAAAIGRAVRAFNPWPVAYTSLGAERLRVWRASVLEGEEGGRPGEIVGVSRAGIEVAAGVGRLRLEQVQLPGGKVLAAGALVNARPDLPGQRLGDAV